MRWRGGRASSNVQDRRGMGGIAAGGGVGAIILALVVYFLGGDPSAVVPSGGSVSEPQPTAENDSIFQFSAVVLGYTEEVWNEIMRQQGTQYREPQMVVFEGSVQSQCGFAQSAMGPFYCPLDESVYLDLGFFNELRSRLGAPGDFAQAYVIAHEVGHHVQTITGISEQVQREQQRVGGAGANELSVRQELQADCYAGIWANHAESMFGVLEPGDIREALGAASAVGDDRLQEAAGRTAAPESFTHGSAEQRMRWFEQGWRSGDPGSCDTFSAPTL